MPRCAPPRPTRMLVRHHPLAHRRAQKRDLRALDEGAELTRPGHALADDDERPLAHSTALSARSISQASPDWTADPGRYGRPQIGVSRNPPKENDSRDTVLWHSLGREQRATITRTARLRRHRIRMRMGSRKRAFVRNVCDAALRPRAHSPSRQLR